VDLAGLAGVLASILGLALTVYGVFFNGRVTRALVRQLHGETQELINATHQDTRALIESTHQDTRTLIESTHRDTAALLGAIQADVKVVAQNGQRRHDDLVAYMQDMDRRHTELLAAIARRQ